MKSNWKAYCLMSSIAYIEEMSKPTEHIQIKGPNNRKFLCFHTINLRMKDPEFVNNFFETTKIWETRKRSIFIGKSFDKPRKDKGSGQDTIFLSPPWLNYILTECGKIPNKYSFETALKRVENIKKYKKILVNKNKNLFKLLLKNKRLAAGAFILSMDLECRGIQNANISLCMSECYKDFLDFMLNVAKKWGWTNNKILSNVKVDYSRNMGINASPQYEFRINIRGLKEIYKIGGPLINTYKNKCIDFHIKRSRRFEKFGYSLRSRKTKEKILKEIKSKKDLTTTNLQFIAGVRSDVVTEHLKGLEKKGLIVKTRNGKRYIWNIK